MIRELAPRMIPYTGGPYDPGRWHLIEGFLVPKIAGGAPPTVYGNFVTKLGIGKEAGGAAGTAVNPQKWIPVTPGFPKLKDDIPVYKEVANRGVAAEVFGHYQLQSPGANFDVDGPFYPDSPGYFLFGAYGQDTITAAPASTTVAAGGTVGSTSITLTLATGYIAGMAILIGTGATQEGNLILALAGAVATLAGPLRFAQAGSAVAGNTVHNFQMNVAITPPPTFTMWDYYGVNWRQYVFGTVESFDLRWKAHTEASYAAKMRTFLSTSQSSPGASSFASVPPFVGWQAGLAIAGGALSTNLMEFDLNVKRKLVAVPGATNSLNPNAIFAATLDVAGKAVLQMSADTEYNLFRNATYGKLQMALFGPAPGAQTIGATGLLWTGTQTDYTLAVIDRAREFVQVQVDFQCDNSSTDAGPSQVFLTNSFTSYP